MPQPTSNSLKLALTVCWSFGRLLVPLSLATVFTWASGALVPLRRGSQARSTSTIWETCVLTHSTWPQSTLSWTMTSVKEWRHISPQVGAKALWGITDRKFKRLLNILYVVFQLLRSETLLRLALRSLTPLSLSPGSLSADSATRYHTVNKWVSIGPKCAWLMKLHPSLKWAYRLLGEYFKLNHGQLFFINVGRL